MIAIVHYNQPSTLSIISILISIMSIISKSFVFCALIGIDMRCIFFHWFCAIIDFCGIFFICSWVFYNPFDSKFNFYIIIYLFIFIKYIYNILKKKMKILYYYFFK
jgi:hypothetical protein